MNIKLEIFFTKLHEDKIVYHRHTLDIANYQENPDDIILKLVSNETNETPNMIDDKFVIHSTSGGTKIVKLYLHILFILIPSIFPITQQKSFLLKIL